MPSNFKDFFDQDLVAGIAADLARAYPDLRRRAFVAACLRGLEGLELLARGWHIAEAMRRHLPQDFERAADVLIASLGPEPGPELPVGMAPFRYLPHVFFVSKYGLDHFDASMRAQYELTKRFSAEFSIRAFLERYPQTYERLRKWASDPNVHVRRLVSEGTRPRLPWAPRLRAYQKAPAPVVALLELLKDDPELYVRRSVANSLNDIAKDHPALAVEVARRWQQGASPERQWVIRHALRSLVKQGHPGALAVMGFATAPKVSVAKPLFTPRVIRIGETLRFSFELAGASKKQQTLLVDFAVHFVKANGGTSPKVFKLRAVKLRAGSPVMLAGSVSFKQHTTRKHYPGAHRIEVLINGVAFPLGKVRVTA